MLHARPSLALDFLVHSWLLVRHVPRVQCAQLYDTKDFYMLSQSATRGHGTPLAVAETHLGAWRGGGCDNSVFDAAADLMRCAGRSGSRLQRAWNRSAPFPRLGVGGQSLSKPLV